MRRCLLLFLCSCLLWCARAREVDFTILHTTDLHGHLLASTDYEGQFGGGLLRIAHQVEQLRTEIPNIILLDGGDFIQGTPHSFLSRGELTRRAMEHLRYDAVVIGNHEFDWGLPWLRDFCRNTSLPLLGGNIRDPDVNWLADGAQPEHHLPNLRAFRLLTLDGIRIAIIGLNTPGMDGWFRREELAPLQVEPSIRALHRIMPQVRETDPDIILLLAHMGYPARGRQWRANDIELIIEQFPEIDGYIGGHTHRLHQARLTHNRFYAQAGYHAHWLGRIDLTYDTLARAIVRVACSSLRMAADAPEDPALRAKLGPELDRIEQQLDQPIGSIATRLTPVGPQRGQSGIQQLLCDAIAAATSCDLIVHGVLSDRASLDAGPVHERDLWHIVPYANRIVVLSLTQRELRNVLEDNARLLHHPYFLGTSGFRYRADWNAAAGQQIGTLIFPDGSPFHSTKRYRVAFNSFSTASAGGRLPALRALADQLITRPEFTGLQTREALRTFLQANPDYTPPPSNGGYILP